MDEVGRMKPDDVNAEDLPGVLAVQHLGHALTLLLSEGLFGQCKK